MPLRNKHDRGDEPRPTIPHAIPTHPGPTSTQNPQNSNDQTSNHETYSRELHAKLLGRQQSLAGKGDDVPSHTSAHQAPLVWRAPEGPEGTGGLRDAAPNAVRSPSLAGGRALRRPEHKRCHTATTRGADGERAGRPRCGRRSVGEQATAAGFTRPRGGRPRA